MVKEEYFFFKKKAFRLYKNSLRKDDFWKIKSACIMLLNSKISDLELRVSSFLRFIVLYKNSFILTTVVFCNLFALMGVLTFFQRNPTPRYIPCQCNFLNISTTIMNIQCHPNFWNQKNQDKENRFDAICIHRINLMLLSKLVK